MKIISPPQRQVTVFQGMVTVAPNMLEFFELMSRVARTDATVLIRGETGTGKELVARAIHTLSSRAKGPFQELNCATLTPELLASELFGHIRGAFTGAIKDHPGLFARANKGTVFLDEIAELPLDLQARLLRVLQERSFIPVGGMEPKKVDVRVLSATNKALREEVAQGRFREDLMYRIRVVPLFLPRLKDRPGDVETLTWYFIREFNQRGLRQVTAMEASAMEALLAYPWQGNVRELQNVVEYTFSLGEGSVLTLAQLPPDLRGLTPPGPRTPPSPPRLADLERERLVDALRESRGRKGEAARLLGISRATLWRKMREHRLNDYP
ncbi:MAG: sigma-54 dependent transcriptional regulator [Deltaproteobacteria bacterium]|nr:sigma-54 dependent transcriptional regulator [Deltaproteobacteria bacterium]